MLVVKQRLAELGFNSEISLGRSDTSGRGNPLRELRMGPQDLLLIHHWSYQPHLERLADLRAQGARLSWHHRPPLFRAR